MICWFQKKLRFENPVSHITWDQSEGCKRIKWQSFIKLLFHTLVQFADKALKFVNVEKLSVFTNRRKLYISSEYYCKFDANLNLPLWHWQQCGATSRIQIAQEIFYRKFDGSIFGLKPECRKIFSTQKVYKPQDVFQQKSLICVTYWQNGASRGHLKKYLEKNLLYSPYIDQIFMQHLWICNIHPTFIVSTGHHRVS